MKNLLLVYLFLFESYLNIVDIVDLFADYDLLGATFVVV